MSTLFYEQVCEEVRRRAQLRKEHLLELGGAGPLLIAMSRDGPVQVYVPLKEDM